MSNMDSKLEHGDLRAIPEGKDLERLNGMYEQFCATSEQAGRAMSIEPIFEGVEYYGALTIVNAGASHEFKGIALCPHCIERAALLLRDLATVLDDINAEVKKHAK